MCTLENDVLVKLRYFMRNDKITLTKGTWRTSSTIFGKGLFTACCTITDETQKNKKKIRNNREYTQQTL